MALGPAQRAALLVCAGQMSVCESIGHSLIRTATNCGRHVERDGRVGW